MSRSLPPPLLVVLAASSCVNLVGALWLIPDRGSDFLALYLSGSAWGQGLAPYEADHADIPNLTPPVLLPFLRLFATFPFHIAFLLWTALSIGCVVAALPTITKRVGFPPWQTALVVLGIAPAGITLALGQVGFILLLGFTRAWEACYERRWLRMGLWIGALCVVKPFFGLFGVWLLSVGRWRSAMAAVGVWVVGIAASLMVGGRTGLIGWISALREIGWQANFYNASVLGVGARLFGPVADSRATRWSPLWVSDAWDSGTVVVLTALIVAALVHGIRHYRHDVDRVFLMLGAGGLLLSPLGWVHYVVALIGPVLCIAPNSRWALLFWTLALFPYQTLLNRTYGPMGSVLAGQWAFGLTVGLLLMALTGLARRAQGNGKQGVPDTACP